MEDVTQKLIDSVTSSLAAFPEQRRKLVGNIETMRDEVKEDKKRTYLSFLKDEDDLLQIYRLIKNKKLSNNQIRKKIKEFLNDPEDLNDFLKSILSEKGKKEENTEATGAGSAGGYSMPLFSTTKGDITKGVKTVRESLEVEDSELKKTETKEATTSASSGQYSQPAIWAKSLKKKDFAGYKKPLYKGGKFVQVKKKCKTFPYCNQGDIGALNIFENESVKSAVDSVSKNYGLDKNYIFELLYQEMTKTK
jgi:hypothetical protein